MTASPTRDRLGSEVLSYATCLGRLDAGVVGRIAFLDAGTPVIVPVNYTLDGTYVVFRSAVGAKLDAATRRRQVAFEIDGFDATTRSGWSVLVTGTAESVDDPAAVARLDALGLDSWALPERDGVGWVRVLPDIVTGRRVAPRPARRDVLHRRLTRPDPVPGPPA